MACRFLVHIVPTKVDDVGILPRLWLLSNIAFTLAVCVMVSHTRSYSLHRLHVSDVTTKVAVGFAAFCILPLVVGACLAIVQPRNQALS